MFIYKCFSCGYEVSSEKELSDVVCPKCSEKMLRVKPPMKLGEILVHFGLIDAEKVERALDIQKRIDHHYPLGKILVKLGLISSNQLYEILGIQRKAFFGAKL